MTFPSQHFIRREFECQCGCGTDTVDAELLFILDDLRSLLGVPVTITSGYRCEIHNKDVGGANNSQHLIGKAADIRVNGYSPKDVYELLDQLYPDKYGIGLYQNWIHIDVRSSKARWGHN